jgi:hypothetical protein
MLFTDASDVAQYTLAGKATVVLTSQKTGVTYTYRVWAPRNDHGQRFVKVAQGNKDAYLGMIQPDGVFTLTAKSRMSNDDEPVRAFRYFSETVLRNHTMPAKLQIRHDGTCGRCGRTLTVPESIDNGIGPECIKMLRTNALMENL